MFFSHEYIRVIWLFVSATGWRARGGGGEGDGGLKQDLI